MAKLYSVETANPAGQLWGILTRLRNTSGGDVFTNMSSALGVPTGDRIGYIAGLAKALQLIDMVETRIKATPGINHDLHLYTLPSLRNIFAEAAENSDFNQWKAKYLREDLITPIIFCSNVLGKMGADEEINAENLANLLAEVNKLYESVITSSLSADIKLMVLEQLESIRRALHEYRVAGIVALEQALAAAVGQVALHREEFQREKGKEIDRFGKVLTTLDTLISVATKAKPLLAPLVQYIPRLLGS
jgi:hypothetical protein